MTATDTRQRHDVDREQDEGSSFDALAIAGCLRGLTSARTCLDYNEEPEGNSDEASYTAMSDDLRLYRITVEAIHDADGPLRF